MQKKNLSDDWRSGLYGQRESIPNGFFKGLSSPCKKGRTKQEVDEVIRWLTGYSQAELEGIQERPVTYGDFFRNAPALNENRKLIKGVVCGVRVEEIQEPLMQEIRYLDKLVDELARGKSMEKILRK